LTLIFFPVIGFLAVPLAFSIASWVNVFLPIRAHKKLNSFMLNSFLVKYTLKSIFFALFLFCFLSIIDVRIYHFILNDIYKIIIELLLISPLVIFFLFKIEIVIYRKIINFFRNL
jgi:hypothetical protein